MATGTWRHRLPHAIAIALTLLAAGCATLPAGIDAPKLDSIALAKPETTTLGRRLGERAREHAGLSGFNLLLDGTDSFAMRMSIARKAEKTLDLQYFLLQQDDTGRLLLGALLDAADRGVRVRLLLDDALGIDGGADDQAARCAPQYRNPRLQSVRGAAGARPAARRRERAAGRPSQLPDAQQALRRRQRHRRHRRPQYRRRVFPGEHGARVRRLRPRGGRTDGARAVTELRRLLERPPCGPGRCAAPRQAVLGGPRGLPRGAGGACTQDGDLDIRSRIAREPTHWRPSCRESCLSSGRRRHSPTTPRTRRPRSTESGRDS